jgi:hypothetical protein
MTRRASFSRSERGADGRLSAMLSVRAPASARLQSRSSYVHRGAARRLLSLWVIGVIAASSGCGAVAGDAPAPLAMQVRVPQITLDRLDAQMHLRVFEQSGDLGCDPASGRVTGTNAYDVIAGKSVSPHERCDAARWAQLRMANGEASPVDTCFDKNGGLQTHRVPGGKTYIVLVEGSGTVPAPGGGTQTRTLGSGCSVVSAMPGQTISVAIEMQEVADIGRCGDMIVSSGEVCDEGMPTETCNARCRIPEISVATSITGLKERPSLAWAMSQNLLVGFNPNASTDDPHLRMLDPNGRLITTPAVLARDNPLDAMARSQQTGLRVAAAPTGYAAVWQTLERGSFDINGFATLGYDAPTPQQLLVNATTAGMGDGMISPAVAISGNRVVFVWEDASARVIRMANTMLAATPAMPMADQPLVAAGMAGASAASAPSIIGLSDGTFVAGWVSGGTGAKDVYLVKLSSAGAAMGAPIIANSQTGMDQDQVALGTNGSDVVAAWRDNSGVDPMDTSGTTVRWRRFSSALAPDGADRLAPTTTDGDQSAPTVAVAPSGAVLIAWQHAGGTIRGRLFRVDGSQVVNRFNASTADFEVNASADEGGPAGGMRETPSAAFGGTGRFAVGWRDGTTNDIRVRVFIE